QGVLVLMATGNTLVVTFKLDTGLRTVVTEALADAATPVWLTDLDDASRVAALRDATAILAHNTGQELHPHEPAAIGPVRLIQFVTAGAPIASNGGAYAEPMAEHGLAMALAAAKRLLIEQRALEQGVFNQHVRNRTLMGGVCGILGFGGIGVALARLMRGVGMRIHAINRRGASDTVTDWIGTPAQLDEMLAASDVLMICTPLTRATQDLLGARELALMKEDAILVNLARGEIVSEAALFAHLQAHPRFFACIDAWWE